MEKAMILLGAFALVTSTYALPVYDDFSGYGTPGTWTQVSGPPIVSYTAGAPLLGGNTAPSGEGWIVYTNAPASALYITYYSGVAFTGYDKQNVAIVNYFGDGQPGASDTMSASLPTGFPGPFVAGLDTRTNSVWTPGWGQTGEVTPPLQAYLGGAGACLQFANPVPGVTGNKVFVSFFVDIPDCTGSYGAGQSLSHGYTAGFMNAAELPSLPGNQYALPGYTNTDAGFPLVPLMEKFNMREVSASTWRPGVGYLDSNGNSVSAAVSQKTIHFIVMSYEFNGGATLDKVGVWSDPSYANFGVVTEPVFGVSTSPSAGYALPDVGGFFFLANTQDGGATPNSGVFFNSLRIGTTWSYVTGGPEFTNRAPANVYAFAGQTVTLNSAAVAGGVTPTYIWTNSSGPLTPGSHFSVGPAGALTITNVQASDADTYTLLVSTPITTVNGIPPSTAQSVLTVLPFVPYFTAESWAGGVFTGHFTGPSGIPYHILTAPALTSPASTWTSVASGNFSGGDDTVTDHSASGSEQFYLIAVP
jgi:hypothetical protein